MVLWLRSEQWHRDILDFPEETHFQSFLCDIVSNSNIGCANNLRRTHCDQRSGHGECHSRRLWWCHVLSFSPISFPRYSCQVICIPTYLPTHFPLFSYLASSYWNTDVQVYVWTEVHKHTRACVFRKHLLSTSHTSHIYKLFNYYTEQSKKQTFLCCEAKIWCSGGSGRRAENNS